MSASPGTRSTQTIAKGLGVEAKIVHVPTDTVIRYKPDWAGPLLGDKTWTVLFDNSKIKRVAGDFTCETDLSKILERAHPLLQAAPGGEDALQHRRLTR